MTEEIRPAHSKLGASGAERWMRCAGSVALLKHLGLEESDEPDYRREGTAGHEAAAYCLNNGLDAWEVVGQEFYGTVMTEEMGHALAVYLNHCRTFQDLALRSYIEHPISSPVHKDFYGTLDFGALIPRDKYPEYPLGLLKVVDLKMGQGVMVDVEENPQIMYYAFGLIDSIERSGYIAQFYDDMPVELTIAQPRGYLEPIRTWTTTVGAIKTWVSETLVPAMENTQWDDTLDAGPWCRFCPAKLVCPLLTSLFRAAATYNPKEVVHIDDESLGRSYQYVQAVDFYVKALKEETFKRAEGGKVVPGVKLVHKRANRVFRDQTADGLKLADALIEEFGEDAFSKPAPKSPPDIEKLGPAGKEFVKRWAYKPETGLTLALDTDKAAGPGVVIRKVTDIFSVDNLPAAE